MRAPGEPMRRRGVVLPALVILVALAALVGLGVWQLDRKVWKEALIAKLEERIAQPPVALPAATAWDGLDQVEWEFRRVRFTAQFRAGAEALVYTSGSPLRADVTGPGYWVFVPATTPDGGTLVVNRGFLPQGRQDAGAPTSVPQAPGAVDLVGVLRWPEPRSVFLQADDPARNTFFARDHRAMATAKGWGAVAPFYVEQEVPVPPGGLPRPGPMQVKLRNEHLQYALTWFGLAAVLAVAAGVWLTRRREEPQAPPPPAW